MATILTVCTTQVPARAINHFLQESLQGPPYAFDFFCILQTPSQTEVDRKGTKPDIQDFTSGLTGKTEDEIRHLHEWIARNGRAGGASNRWIAVLDEKFAEESTVQMHYAVKKSYWDEMHEQAGVDASIPGHARICKDGGIWWTWRVPFRLGFYFWNSIASCGMEALELYFRPEYLRADGVVDIEICSKTIDGDIEDPMERM